MTWHELGLVWLPWLGGAVAFSVAVALVAGGGRARTLLALALVACGLCAPFIAPERPLLRATLSLYLAWSSINVIELVRDGRPRSKRFRVAQVLVLHDLRLDTYAQERLAPELRPALLGTALLAAFAGLLCWYCVLGSVHWPSASLRWLGRYGAGLLLVYLAVEAAVRALSFLYRGVGLRPPRLHDHPILARSIAEFWGRRWNRIVGIWLRRVAFAPLSARGYARSGIMLAFVLSGLLHLYFTWAAIGFGLACMMASFFLLQPPLIALERWLHVRSWRRSWQRVWTLGSLIILSPLFVEPFLRVIEPR